MQGVRGSSDASPAARAGASAHPPPRTWLLVGEKPGDNAQIRVVGEALGWPIEERRVAMRDAWVRGKPRMRPSLDHVALERSDRLEPPWPDLILTIGRRLSMVALWIRARSGARSRIVLLGIPRRLGQRFDLIVATGQYRAPRGRNVLQLGLPLVRVDPAAVTAAAEIWRPRLSDLARPLTAVLVGGPTKPVSLDAAVARRLAEDASRLVSESGGSLFVSTSRRTPPEVTDALAAALPAGSTLYRWQPEAPEENPYLALLGLADQFVVTTDSVTMMVEVARLGRPLRLFELPFVRGAWWRTLGSPRDLRAIPRLLYERGLATRLGAPARAPAGLPPDELPRVVARIRALFEDSPTTGVAAPASRAAV
jgi:hypothetical protein